MSTGRIEIYFVIIDMRNLEYMCDGNSYDDIKYADTFSTYDLAKEEFKKYDDDVQGYLKIYKIEERTEWKMTLIDESVEIVGE